MKTEKENLLVEISKLIDKDGLQKSFKILGLNTSHICNYVILHGETYFNYGYTVYYKRGQTIGLLEDRLKGVLEQVLKFLNAGFHL